MELVRWEPFEGLNRIQSRINDLFDDTFGRARSYPASTAGVWVPPVDILESKDSYLIRAELPGMKKTAYWRSTCRKPKMQSRARSPSA